MIEWSQKEIKTFLQNEELTLLYLYTPLCGTCQVAGKMVSVVAELLPNIKWGKADLNYLPDIAESWSIQSVPCLVIIKNRTVQEKIYAFHSVPYLYDEIKQLQATGSK